MIASTFKEDIKAATGLDLLEVEKGEQENETCPGGIKVTLGKDLSRRMTLKCAMESKDGEQIQRAIAEYKLLENFLLSGFQNNVGDFGGGIQYRLEFR